MSDELAASIARVSLGIMNDEQKTAYEWARNQNYTSVAAQYAKLLSEVVDELAEQLTESQGYDSHCPECGSRLVHIDGCVSCPNCGWSACG